MLVGLEQPFEQTDLPVREPQPVAQIMAIERVELTKVHDAIRVTDCYQIKRQGIEQGYWAVLLDAVMSIEFSWHIKCRWGGHDGPF
jgi:hypothetical protein